MSLGTEALHAILAVVRGVDVEAEVTEERRADVTDDGLVVDEEDRPLPPPAGGQWGR